MGKAVDSCRFPVQNLDGIIDEAQVRSNNFVSAEPFKDNNCTKTLD